MATASKVRIDSEFESLCPPLTPEERSLLEMSLALHGCRDPLVVWRGLLVDGHNRYSFCTSEGMEFDTVELDVASREEVIEWIITNQLGRRNLTEDQKSYLRGKRYSGEKKSVGRQSKSESVSDLDTASRLAAEYGVSDRTIRNDAAFATAVDTLAKNVGPEIKAEILSGASPLTKKQIIAAAELPPKQQAKAVSEQVIQGKASPPPKRFCAADEMSDVLAWGRKQMRRWPKSYSQQLSQLFVQLSKEALTTTDAGSEANGN